MRVFLLSSLIFFGCAVDDRFADVPEGSEYVPGSGGKDGSDSGGSTNGETGGNNSAGGMAGASSGGRSAAGGGSADCTSDVVFEGDSAKADGCNSAEIDGAFHVAMDSYSQGYYLKDYYPYLDGSYLIPDSGLVYDDNGGPAFSEQSVSACASGHIGKITTAAGTECDPLGADSSLACQNELVWGAALGLVIDEGGASWGEGSRGVRGLRFRLSGKVRGTPIRLRVWTDQGAVYCKDEVAIGSSVDIDFDELTEQCEPGGAVLEDLSSLVLVDWQLVSTSQQSAEIESFCVDRLEVLR